MNDKTKIPHQVVVHTGVETLIEFDDTSVSDVDANAVVGVGIMPPRDGGIGIDFEVGGVYFDSTELAFYPGDKADIEERFFAGLAATWRSKEFSLLAGSRDVANLKFGLRDVMFENDFHLGNAAFVVEVNRGALYATLEAGITHYVKTPTSKHAAPIAIGAGIVAQHPLDGAARAELLFANGGIDVATQEVNTKIGGKVSVEWCF